MRQFSLEGETRATSAATITSSFVRWTGLRDRRVVGFFAVEVVELRSRPELHESFAVMRELRDHHSEDEYVDLVTEMMANGYRLFAGRDGTRIVAAAGVAMFTNLYYGRYLWVYDLVTRSDERSRGYGGELLRYLENFAWAQGCDVVALSSALHRTDAHRFYEGRMGYERAGYAFKKAL